MNTTVLTNSDHKDDRAKELNAYYDTFMDFSFEELLNYDNLLKAEDSSLFNVLDRLIVDVKTDQERCDKFKKLKNSFSFYLDLLCGK